MIETGEQDKERTLETLKSLYKALRQEKAARAKLETQHNEPIAVVGMACRFPGGASDPAAFWELLETGGDAIRQVPAQRWDAAAFAASGLLRTQAGGFIDPPLDQFDYEFFRLSPREARALDPQQRLLLEVAWEALESEGAIPADLRGSRTGVFIGISGDDYTMAERHATDLQRIGPYSITGTTASTAAGRLAYFFGFEGPAVPIDTACSSSLVAMHLACQSLRSGETDRVLAGGVNLILAPNVHACFSQLQAISPDGRCKSFSADADGYGRAEGCGLVVLKRLSDAVAANDRILGLIEASAANQDGASNGFTAPNGAAQKRLLHDILARAGLEPDAIDYVETHGTGTPLGDPIEADALIDAYGAGRDAQHPLVLGAVKSNIGHLEAAAGIAGIIKVLLAFERQAIPRNLHCDEPNPLIPWSDSPVVLPQSTRPWPRIDTGHPRRAGVSSFGFSGTNAHVLLREPPLSPLATAVPEEALLLAISAPDEETLQRRCADIAGMIAGMNYARLRDVCATALRHRHHFRHRFTAVGSDAAALCGALTNGKKSAPTSLDALATTWRQGNAIDAAKLFPDGTYRRVDLPRFPFAPLPCSLDETSGTILPGLGIPALFRPLAANSSRRGWRVNLDDPRLAALHDHRVFGTPIMPAAGYISLIAALPELVARPVVGLDDVAFVTPLALTRAQHLDIWFEEADGIEVVRCTSPRDGGETVHCQAVIAANTQFDASAAPDLDAGEAIDVEAVFSQHGRALSLGSRFRAANAIRHQNGRFSAKLGGIAPAAGILDPALLDALFQLVVFSRAKDGLELPVLARRIRYDRSAGQPQAGIVETETQPARIALWGQASPALIVEGLEGRPVSEEQLRTLIDGAQEFLCQTEWQALPETHGTATLPGDWVLVSPLTDDATPPLASAMLSAWPACAMVGAGFSMPGNVDTALWLDAAWPEETPAALRIERFLDFATGLPPHLRTLHVVTRAAFALEPDDAVQIDPAARAIWGIVRSLREERRHPALTITDLPKDVGATTLDALGRQLSGPAPADECVLRGQAFAPVLVPLAMAPKAPLPVHAEGRYLITGGGGALGSLLGDWLLAQGAGHVVLTGRSACDAPLSARIEASAGRLSHAQGDAADATFLKTCRDQTGPFPLRGIFHLAGDPGAGMLDSQQPADIERALHAKMNGAVAISALATTSPDIDFIVHFSSLAAQTGAAGQGLYCAANAFLEALAERDDARQQRTIALALGPVSTGGAGMAESVAAQTQMQALGLSPMAFDGVTRTLAWLLGSTETNVCAFRAIPMHLPPAPVLARVQPTAGAAPKVGTRPADIADFLAGQINEALGRDRSHELDPDRDLFELGIDSLMALRVRNAAEAAFGVSLPGTLIFDNPTLCALAAAIRAASISSAAPLAATTAPVIAAGVVATGKDRLSAGQEGIWLRQQFAPESAAFHTVFSARLEGQIDLPALEASFRDVIARHDALCCRIVPDLASGAPRRVPADAATFHLRELATDDPAQPRDYLQADTRRPFDLEHDLPIRAAIARLAPNGLALAITIHHVSVDVWSFEIILRELAEAYARRCEGGHADLGIAQSYAAFVEQQCDDLDGARGNELRQFWRVELEGLPAPGLPLLSHAENGADRMEAFTLHGRVTPELFDQLDALTQRHGVTLYTLLMAVWAALDHRCGGGRPGVLGTPMHGRNNSRWANTVGFFVSVVPVRYDLGECSDLAELLIQIKGRMLRCMEHQDLPFADICREAGEAGRNASYPLFHTLFHLRNLEPMGEGAGLFLPGMDGEMRVGPLRYTPFFIDQQEGQYPLVVEWFKTKGGLHYALKFNNAYYDRASAEGVAGLYLAFLAALAAAPDTPLADLPLPAPPVQAVVQRPAWRIDERIAHHAARIPAEEALRWDGGSLTYDALDETANGLAHTLAKRGIVPGNRVGVHMERSASQILALIAIAKVGAAYVPLPKDSPTHTLAQMAEATDLACIVTDGPLPNALGSVAFWQLPDMADIGRVAHPPLHDGGTEDTLYVLHTSGSTGEPKGVMVSHRAVSSLIDAMDELLGLPPRARWLAKTPLGFDPSVAEIFFPLCCGGLLSISPAGEERDPAALNRRIGAEAIDALMTVPSQLAAMLRESDAADHLGGLRRIFTGGEPLTAAICAVSRTAAPQARLINAYGPTEATVLVSAWQVPDELPGSDAAIRIGRPLANAVIRILDDCGHPVPVGVAGQLHIGGPCLFTGYAGRVGLTAQVLVDDPLGTGPLYASGDRARWMPASDGDCAIEFLGRTDRQVKVSGIRIELDGIEAILRTVAPIAVRTIIAPSGEKVLGAAFEATSDTAPRLGEKLKQRAAETLPPTITPRVWLPLEALPQNRNDKLDTARLDAMLLAALRPTDSARTRTRQAGTSLLSRVARAWARILGVESIDVDRHFYDLGGSSLLMAKLRTELETDGLTGVAMRDLFRLSTARELALFLESGGHAAETPPDVAKTGTATPIDNRIAIIGMDIRVPGANGLEAFWNLIESGASGLTRFDRKTLEQAGVPVRLLNDPDYVPVNGRLEAIDQFDAALFGFSPAEAQQLDPQLRLFLEAAWLCLDHAGYGSRQARQKVGVFVGSELSNYLLFNLADQLDPMEMNGGYALSLGNDKDALATRVAFACNLRGPAMSVQTACSTGLSAVALACEALISGQCDMALAGGVSIGLPQDKGYLYRIGMVASQDGQCRPFDAGATGTVNGNGLGVVLLKPLAKALADGDTVHAVVRGWAMNNDGSAKVGYTAPSEMGQAAAVESAWRHAGVSPADIGYLEAHGTGTVQGDPIEIAALVTAASRFAPAPAKAWLGAVKANIGHLGVASGIVGLIKTALVVNHGRIPPLRGFERANPAIDFDSGFLRPAREAMDWTSAHRIAGVSSFGIGGTNVHVVLEAAPELPRPVTPAPAAHLLPLSASTEAGLDALFDRIEDHLTTANDLGAIAHTLQLGRYPQRWRGSIVAHSAEDARTALAQARRNGCRAKDAPHISAFFPGQGSQHPDMALGLYHDFPQFREALEHGFETLAPLTGRPPAEWRAMLLPSLGGTPSSADLARAAAELSRTENTQPALFIVQCALAGLWEAMGIRFEGMGGHSIGEYAAATQAGVFTFKDAAALVVKRGSLMQSLSGGAMLAVGIGAGELAQAMPAELDLAAENGPGQCVVSGPHEAVAAYREDLIRRGTVHHELPTSHAFHSAMMDPILPEFSAAVAATPRSAPNRPLISCLTGDWLDGETATSTEYWVHQLRGTVKFRQSVERLLEAAPAALVEIGPGQALTGQMKRLANGVSCEVLAACRNRANTTTDDREALLAVAGRLWQLGARIDFAELPHESPRRVPLPATPFDRQHYWIDPPPRDAMRAAKPGLSPIISQPAWRAAACPDANLTQARIIGNSGLAEALRAIGVDVGSAPTTAPNCITIVDVPVLSDLLAALSGIAIADPGATVIVVTRNAQDVAGVVPDPDAALAAGAVAALRREWPEMNLRAVDLGGMAPEAEARALLREAGANDPFVAWRRARRHVRTFEPVEEVGAATGLPQSAVVAITGGLGGLGRVTARYLANTLKARLILLGRTPETQLGEEQRALLNELGACAQYLSVDVTDAEATRRELEQAAGAGGRIDAILHCAGHIDERPLSRKSPEAIAAVLAPKVAGTRALAAATAGMDIGLTVYFSSLSSVLGGVGLADYAAANAFLDAMAIARSADGLPTVSIGWDGWAEAGQAAGATRDIAGALETDEALRTLTDVLRLRGLPHVLVSKSDVQAAAKRARTIPPAKVRHERPDLVVAYSAPRNATEMRIGEICAEVLGIAQVGMDDSFFDLGGDSLLGGELIRRINAVCSTTLPAVALYDAPMVRGLAALVDGERPDAALAVEEEPLNRRNRRATRRERFEDDL